MEIPDYLMSVGYLEKQDLRGSWKGMCYRLHVVPAENKGEPGRLQAWCWPQPLCYDAAKEDKKQAAEFVFSKEGIIEAGEWLKGRYESGEWMERNNLLMSSKNT